MLSFRKMSLLLVDSSKMSPDALESSLEPLEFYRLWTAGKTEEAMALLEQKEIHLIICAAKMQPMSGFQLVELVRNRGADMALVLPHKLGQPRQALHGLLANRVDLEKEKFLYQIRAGARGHAQQGL